MYSLKGEGNKHIAIAVNHADAPRILRLRKEDSDQVSLAVQTGYHELLTRMLLGPSYLAPSEIIQMDAGLLKSIIDEIQSKRQETRKHKTIDLNQQVVLLTEDHTLFRDEPGTRQQRKHVVYSVELKPKWGFMPARYHRRRDATKTESNQICCCRFCLHSILKASLKKRIDQQPSKKEISINQDHFCPLDLYSGTHSRVVKALKVLTTCPGNNLKVCVDGIDTSDFKHVEKLFQQSMKSEKSDLIEETQGGGIWDLVAAILNQEELLKSLATHQERLDGGGINVVYQQYLDLKRKCEWIPRQPETLEEWERILNQYLMDEGKEKEKEKDQLQIIMEYLLSLSLKDCSFMLTFRVLSNNDKFEPENGIGHKMTRFKDSTIEYKIRVIDVDIKSIHKIPYYYTQDVEIMNIFNGM